MSKALKLISTWREIGKVRRHGSAQTVWFCRDDEGPELIEAETHGDSEVNDMMAKGGQGMDMKAAFDRTIRLAEEYGMREEEPDGLNPSYLRSMRARMDDTFSDGKTGRWLGWAQCAVVASTQATLLEMKTINTIYSR